MNDIPLSMLFGILVFMLLVSGFLTGSETSLMSINRYRLRNLVKLNHRGAIKAQNLLQKSDRFLSFILLANSFLKNLCAALATMIVVNLYSHDEAFIVAAMAVLTFLMVVFSELTPKGYGATKPEWLAFLAAWIYTPLLTLFYPITLFINGFVRLLLRLVRVDVKKSPNESLNQEELKSIIAEAEDLMPERYQKMLTGILDFESATVEDIMTPRKEIVGIDLEDTIEEIIEQIRTSPHTQLAVYKSNIDRIVGFLHLRKILLLIGQDDFDKQAIINLLSKPTFVPDNTPVHAQLLSFKREKNTIGLVVDEYGDVQGLVTLDDLIQEIVGELVDDEMAPRKQSDGSYMIDAAITLRELNRTMQWTLPTEGPKTLNGLIVEFMETIPESGTSIKLLGHPLEIIKTDEHAVKLVKFLPE